MSSDGIISSATEPLNSTSARRDPRTLTSLPEILSCISSYQTEESELSNSLTELLNAREPIITALDRMRSFVPQLDELREEAYILSDKVSHTAKTADRVGNRVQCLDNEMSRVREAGDRVDQVTELKASLSALRSAMETQDWESAARHCARAMALPQEVVSGPFAESAVPTSESHLPPVQTLQAAREALLSVFQRNFEEASRSRDSTTTSRFFKLFPAIGWDIEGLEVYSLFVVNLVRVRAPSSAKSSSPLYYVTHLTALFESIAMIVDQHQPVVAKYYGPGKMKKVVQHLLDECDRVTKELYEGWEEDRAMKRKLADINNDPPNSMFSSANRRQTSSEESRIDPREIDKILSEIAGMSGRWGLFKKYLAEALKDDITEDINILPPNASETTVMEGPLTDQTGSHRLFESLISVYYIPLDIWYSRTIIDKAHRLSTTDITQYPLVTTTPDDVFYVLKSVMYRLLSTGSLQGVEKSLEQLRDILDRDFIGVIRKKLDDVYRSPATTNMNTRGDKVERDNRNLYITLLNDLDVSSSHLERLMRDLLEVPSINQYFSDQDQYSVRAHIATFGVLVNRFRSVLRVGIEHLFNHVLRSRLRNLILEVYKDVSYVLDEDGYSVAEYQDLVRKRFIKTWEGLVQGYQETFSEGNYRLFIGLTLDTVIRPWEKYILGQRFSELGAVRFDQDLRSLTTYLTSQSAFGNAREKFSRLQQISTLLNLDNEEDVDEFYNGSGIVWKLSAHEARAIAGLRK